MITLSSLPNSATIKPYPFLSNFSFTFLVASLLPETNAIVLLLATKFAIMFNIVWVFPVPGGPFITDILLLFTFSTACFWLILKLNG